MLLSNGFVESWFPTWKRIVDNPRRKVCSGHRIASLAMKCFSVFNSRITVSLHLLQLATCLKARIVVISTERKLLISFEKWQGFEARQQETKANVFQFKQWSYRFCENNMFTRKSIQSELNVSYPWDKNTADPYSPTIHRELSMHFRHVFERRSGSNEYKG